MDGMESKTTMWIESWLSGSFSVRTFLYPFCHSVLGQWLGQFFPTFTKRRKDDPVGPWVRASWLSPSGGHTPTRQCLAQLRVTVRNMCCATWPAIYEHYLTYSSRHVFLSSSSHCGRWGHRGLRRQYGAQGYTTEGCSGNWKPGDRAPKFTDSSLKTPAWAS